MVIILSMLVYFSYAGFNFFDGYLKKRVSTKIKVKSTDELQVNKYCLYYLICQGIMLKT